VVLQKMADLSMRADPGAAQLFINGKRMPGSMVQKLQLPPGTVQVRAQYVYEGKTYTARKSLVLAPGESKNDYLCVKGPAYKCP
jgi:hypothetical protein